MADALRELAARHQTTLFAVLLAAYAVVLARLTGSDDLLIAVPMAARTRPETESVIGLFMNTVTIRVQVDPERTHSDLIRTVHAAIARALGHHEMPFANVVELARPERVTARNPLVQVTFGLEESWVLPDRGGLRWNPELIENGNTGRDRTVGYRRTSRTAGTRQLQQRLVPPHHRPADRRRLPGGIRAAWPSGARIDCSRLRRSCRPTTSRWSGASGPMAVRSPIQTRRRWLRSGPPVREDSVVVEGSDGQLMGAEARRARQGSCHRCAGHDASRPGDRIAILLPCGARLLPALLGVWAVGASYVPLDSIYPDQRLAAMLSDSGASAIIVDSSVAGAPGLPSAAAPIPVIDLKSVDAGESGDGDPLLDLPPSATALTLFTSGSTGRPKGVSVTRRHCRPARHFGCEAALEPTDLFLAVSTFAFDIALLEFLLPVLAGGRVLVADTDQVLDAARLRELLADRGVTALQATPSGWRMLVDAGGIPEGVKLRMTGGEPLPEIRRRDRHR